MPQQPRYVQLPNGSYLEWPEGVTADQFKAKALKAMGQTGRTPVPQKSESELSSFQMATGHDPKAVTSWFDPKETMFAAKEMGKGAVVDTAKGIWSMIHPPSMEEIMKSGLSPVEVLVRRVGSSLGELGKEATQVPGAIKDLATNKEGFALPAMEIQAPRAIGQAVGALATGKATDAALRPGKAMSSSEVTRALTDAVNPPPEQMAAFENTLSQHLDKIVTYAAKKGIKLNSLESLGKAMREASNGIRSHYYEEVLGPFKDLPTDVTSIPGYSGETGAAPSAATLGQLDARLSQINAEMFSRYNKSSEGAMRAAVKSDAELNAEAAGIRSVLYPKLATASGLPVETVAQTRQAFGALDGLAEKTTKSAMQARGAANKAAREPITLNPLSNTKTFVADKAVNKLRGNPVENSISKAISKADVKPYQLPKPHPAAAAKATQRVPIRGGGTPIGKVSTPTAEDVAALSEKFEARKAKVLASRNKTLRRPFYEKQHTPQGSVGPQEGR